MKRTITKIMINEHRILEQILDEFEESLKDLKKAKEIFSKLIWNIEKHFFVEEKVIFSIYNDNEQENEELSRIIKEHREVQWLLKRMQQDINKGITPKKSRLREILRHHEKKENEILYPKFDEELDPVQKKMIIERAGDFLIG
jgi:hemerythrin-like domain-containing protein